MKDRYGLFLFEENLVFGHPLCMAGRSSKWPALRDRFVKEHPKCCITGLKDALEVHHLKSVHEHPDLELDWDNLRTISRPYHFLIGHLCNWSVSNSDFEEHAAEWRFRILQAKRKKL